jgi:hypothetical protein
MGGTGNRSAAQDLPRSLARKPTVSQPGTSTLRSTPIRTARHGHAGICEASSGGTWAHGHCSGGRKKKKGLAKLEAEPG